MTTSGGPGDGSGNDPPNRGSKRTLPPPQRQPAPKPAPQGTLLNIGGQLPAQRPGSPSQAPAPRSPAPAQPAPAQPAPAQPAPTPAQPAPAQPAPAPQTPASPQTPPQPFVAQHQPAQPGAHPGPTPSGAAHHGATPTGAAQPSAGSTVLGFASQPNPAPSAAPQHASPQHASQANTAPSAAPQYASQPNTAPSAAPHTASHANTAPSAAPHYASQPNTAPYGSGPTHGVPQAHPGGPSGPYPSDVPLAPQPPTLPPAGMPAGAQPPPPAADESSAWDVVDNLPGSPFVKFLKISARRAFRLRIEPNEVLITERQKLAKANPPVHDPSLQAFLAWRRSVLFLVACALVPLTIIGIGDSLRHTNWMAIFFVKFAPAFAELVFCVVCWQQLKRWANWREQRRKLFLGWLLFMLTPFVVFIYPLNTFFTELRGTYAHKREALLALGVDGAYRQAVLPFVFSMIAMLQLAPKAISLMPGLIRSSMVIKLLFPGVSAPGWLIVMASPLYALLAYVILIIPYQFTGSGWFIAGVLGVVAGQAALARSGFRLARPQTEAEALVEIKKVRRYYITIMIVSAVLIVVALGSLVAKLNLRATDVILAVLKFESNVLILTMIGADLVVTNLDKARDYTAGKDHVEDATEHKIAAFVSLDHTAPSMHPGGPHGHGADGGHGGHGGHDGYGGHGGHDGRGGYGGHGGHGGAPG